MEESCSMWLKLKNIWRINMSNEIVFDQFFLLQGGLSITEVHKYFILWGKISCSVSALMKFHIELNLSGKVKLSVN